MIALGRLGRVLTVAVGFLPSAPGGQDGPPAPPLKGKVSGRVLEAGTLRPIRGAQVAVDATGDSGGANLERHRAQGLYSTGESDRDGRFVLEGIAVDRKLPFMVTHPRFIRHARTLFLAGDRPELSLEVELQAGGALAGAVVDPEGRPLGRAMVRLSAADRRLFWPDGDDWPALPHRHLLTDRDGRFLFGGLDSGLFRIDVFEGGQVRGAFATAGRGEAGYHGGLAGLEVSRGQVREVTVKPAGNRGTISVSGPARADASGGPVLFALSRDPFRLELCGGPFHPEDPRLGEVQADAFALVGSGPDGGARFRGLPPGGYSAYVISGVPVGGGTAGGAVFVMGRPVELEEGKSVDLRLDRRVLTEVGAASAPVRIVLNAPLTVPPLDGRLEDLCARLLQLLPDNHGVTIAVDPRIADERIGIPAGSGPLWEVLARLCGPRSWKLDFEGNVIRIAK